MQAMHASANDQQLSLWADLSAEIESDSIVRSTDSTQKINDTFVSIDAEVGLELAPGSGVYATLVFEPTTDPEGDRYFQDHGLYVEELFVAYDFGPAAIWLGKFNPEFSIGDEIAPGLYGDEFAGDYELAERIGVSIDAPFEVFGGTHFASVSAFFADTTPLSGSLFTNRGRLSRSDGSVSNTGDLGSFSIAVSGDFGLTGYNVGLRRQSPGRGDRANETGGVLALTRVIGLEDAKIELMAEGAYFPRFDGTRDSAIFATVGGEVELGDFAVSAVYGLRDFRQSSPDHLATASVLYELTDGLRIGAGYRYFREDDAWQHTIGLRLAYELSLP